MATGLFSHSDHRSEHPEAYTGPRLNDEGTIEAQMLRGIGQVSAGRVLAEVRRHPEVFAQIRRDAAEKASLSARGQREAQAGLAAAAVHSASQPQPGHEQAEATPVAEDRTAAQSAGNITAQSWPRPQGGDGSSLQEAANQQAYAGFITNGDGDDREAAIARALQAADAARLTATADQEPING